MALRKRYEALQYPRSKKIIKDSLKLGKVGQLENPLLISLRNLAFQLTPFSLAIKIIDKYFSYRVNQIEI